MPVLCWGVSEAGLGGLLTSPYCGFNHVLQKDILSPNFLYFVDVTLFGNKVIEDVIK